MRLRLAKVTMTKSALPPIEATRVREEWPSSHTSKTLTRWKRDMLGPSSRGRTSQYRQLMTMERCACTAFVGTTKKHEQIQPQMNVVRTRKAQLLGTQRDRDRDWMDVLCPHLVENPTGTPILHITDRKLARTLRISAVLSKEEQRSCTILVQ